MKLTLIFISSLFLCQIANAGIYKWVDAEGSVHFSDQKPKTENVDEVVLKINTYTQTEISASDVDVGQSVVMYSTSWCGYCKKARNYFKKNNIAFTDYDIENNQNAKREYNRMGGKGVPLILVGDKRMSGFSEEGFKALHSPS